MHPLKSVALSAQVIIFSAYEGWKALATNTEALCRRGEEEKNKSSQNEVQQYVYMPQICYVRVLHDKNKKKVMGGMHKIIINIYFSTPVGSVRRYD